MDIKKEETIHLKPMKYLIAINCILLVLTYFNNLTYAQANNSINFNTAINCMQGVWKPVNSRNEGLISYTIYYGHKAVNISYLKDGDFEGLLLTRNGFYDFNSNWKYKLSDSLKIHNLQEDGAYFVWFFEDDIKENGWATLGGVQTYFSCSDEIIEMSDNSMTVLKKQLFLPYTAYNHLQDQGKIKGRDYISEFDILTKLKKARVIMEKAHFHNTPSEGSKRKAFVIKGDEVIIDDIKKDWVKVAYEGKNATTEGWLKRADLQVID
jgi:hypothetical protein